MKTTDIFGKLKKEYLAITPKKSFKKHGWSELRQLLDKQESQKAWTKPVFGWIALSCSIFILTGTIFTTMIGWSNPGDKLYPLKQFSKGLLISVTPQASISPFNKIFDGIKAPKQQLTPTETEKLATPSAQPTKQKENQGKDEKNKEGRKPENKDESIIPSDIKKEETKKEDKKTEDNKKEDQDDNEKSVGQKEESIKDIIDSNLNRLLK